MKFREIERNRYPTSFEFEKLWRHMPVKTGHSQRNHMKCVSRLDENKKFLKTETESSAKNLSEPKSELSNPKTTATRKCRDVVSYILKIYKIKNNNEIWCEIQGDMNFEIFFHENHPNFMHSVRFLTPESNIFFFEKIKYSDAELNSL